MLCFPAWLMTPEAKMIPCSVQEPDTTSATSCLPGGTAESIHLKYQAPGQVTTQGPKAG